MIQKWLLISTTALVLTCLTGCIHFNCNEERRASVEMISGPNSGKVGEDILFYLTYYATNGCGSFQGISDTREDNTITVEGKVKYSGCVCPEVLVVFEEQYIFKASSAGTYEIIFLSTGSNTFKHTITIN